MDPMITRMTWTISFRNPAQEDTSRDITGMILDFTSQGLRSKSISPNISGGPDSPRIELHFYRTVIIATRKAVERLGIHEAKKGERERERGGRTALSTRPVRPCKT